VRTDGHGGVRTDGHGGVRTNGHGGVRTDGHGGERTDGHGGVLGGGLEGVLGVVLGVVLGGGGDVRRCSKDSRDAMCSRPCRQHQTCGARVTPPPPPPPPPPSPWGSGGRRALVTVSLHPTPQCRPTSSFVSRGDPEDAWRTAPRRRLAPHDGRSTAVTAVAEARAGFGRMASGGGKRGLRRRRLRGPPAAIRARGLTSAAVDAGRCQRLAAAGDDSGIAHRPWCCFLGEGARRHQLGGKGCRSGEGGEGGHVLAWWRRTRPVARLAVGDAAADATSIRSRDGAGR